MKHLEFVGKSTEHIGYTHVEIINSSLRLSFNVPKQKDLNETFKKIVENNYDLLMETSEKIEFELDIDVIEQIEKITKEQGIEFEEYVQNALIHHINQSELTNKNL